MGPEASGFDVGGHIYDVNKQDKSVVGIIDFYLANYILQYREVP